MSKGIKFSDSCHWYAKDGKPKHDATLREARKQFLYPSVTSIDKDSFPNLFLERWKLNQLALACCNFPRQPHEIKDEEYCTSRWRLAMDKADEAAIFGKKVHSACENWPAVPASDVLPWYLKFDSWMIKNSIVPYEREKRVLHHGIGVAGTMDFKGGAKASRIIMDYKTQDVKVDDRGNKKPAFYDSWIRQLGFYEQADRIENGYVEPSQCVSLIIDSNEGGEVYDKWWTKEEIQASYEEFLAGAWLWFRKRGYWPVGEWKMERV
jgi:hypothetical protein